MYEDKVTLYNIINGVGYKTVFENVHFEANTGVAVEDTGMKENDKALCLIPFSSIEKSKKVYVNYKEFEKMSDEERKTRFTFKSNDKFVLGDIDFDITNVKPNTIADLERNYVDVYTLSNFIQRKLGNSKINHFELSGK